MSARTDFLVSEFSIILYFSMYKHISQFSGKVDRFCTDSDVKLAVYLGPFLQHFSNPFLLQGDVIGHLNLQIDESMRRRTRLLLYLFPFLTLGLNWKWG